MKLIVFIESALGNPNNIKRMEEFASRGYDVVAYAFDRGDNNKNHPEGIEEHIIGHFRSDSSYISRINIIRKGIKNVVSWHKKDDCIFYLFREEMALVYSFVSTRPYIYEEADLTVVTLGNRFVQKLLARRINYIIKHSVISAFRSEGFLQYHFGDKIPDNVFAIPNRLHPRVLDLPKYEERPLDESCIKFGFVGVIRYDLIYSFAETVLKYFPQHQFFFFGIFQTKAAEEKFKQLERYQGFHFSGAFKNPEDLPRIYNTFDVLLSTYDATSCHRYAEPNKLYEAIYFNKPIIVSPACFLADKVSRLGVGYEVNPRDVVAVKEFVANLSIESIQEKKANIAKIDKNYCINSNREFFNLLEKKIIELS